MTNKNANIKQFDGVRAIAILSIVACHLCYGFNAMSPVGQYLGGTFNFVFFLLSALLIGISVKKRKCPSGGLSKLEFLKRRLTRLIPELWIFLSAYIVIMILAGIPLNYKAVLMNYGLLGWFAKLPYLGHLWFVTMILMCYILFSMLLNVKNRRLATCILIGVCCVGQLMLISIKMPAYMFVILGSSGLTMIFSDKVVLLLNTSSVKLSFVVAAALNCLYYILIDKGYLVIGNLDYYYAGLLSGISMFVFLYQLFKIIPVGNLLTIISLLSYQIYLVHHPMCNVNYLNGMVNNTLISIVIIALTSIFAACLLRYCSNYIASRIKSSRKQYRAN